MRLALFGIVVLGIWAIATAGIPAKLTYKDVKPIFDKRCGGCHGAVHPKENLVLTSYAGIMKGGKHGKIIVPKKPASSKLIGVLKGNMKPKMPPGPAKLPAAEIKKLSDWIQAGAAK